MSEGEEGGVRVHPKWYSTRVLCDRGRGGACFRASYKRRYVTIIYGVSEPRLAQSEMHHLGEVGVEG